MDGGGAARADGDTRAAPGAAAMGLPSSAAAERNKAPILHVLERVLPVRACVLEIASGTGQHAAYAAAARPLWTWQPTDADARAIDAVAQRCAPLANVRPAFALDVLAWPLPRALGGPFDAVFCANMIHIAPWEACAALMRLAAHELAAGGVLAIYGPFVEDGVPTAPGNLAFDAELRHRDPRWGLRRLADVDAEAARAALLRVERHAMPANNLTLVYRRAHRALG